MTKYLTFCGKNLKLFETYTHFTYENHMENDLGKMNINMICTGSIYFHVGAKGGKSKPTTACTNMKGMLIHVHPKGRKTTCLCPIFIF